MVEVFRTVPAVRVVMEPALRLIAKLRPPRKVTDAVKRRLINGHSGSPQDYELDHLIPLGLGGHPTSANNLWLQHWSEAAIKDRDELRLNHEVCAGRMTFEPSPQRLLATCGA